MRIQTSIRVLAAAAMVSLSAGAALADLKIDPPFGTVDSADFETQVAGMPGMPLNTYGYAHPSLLRAVDSGLYRFTWWGSGDAADHDTFTLGPNPFSTPFFINSPPVGGTGGAASPIFHTADVYYNAGDLIDFRYNNLTTGCSIESGFDSSSGGESCHYLLAIEGSGVAGGIPTDLQGPVAYIGFSDRPANNGGTIGDHDYQDLTVRVEQVPEPLSMALLGIGLAGLGIARRRKAG